MNVLSVIGQKVQSIEKSEVCVPTVDFGQSFSLPPASVSLCLEYDTLLLDNTYKAL